MAVHPSSEEISKLDAYAREVEAVVLEHSSEGVVLDRTVF